MEILKHAIKCEGSIPALARALGVSPQVINNWRYRQRLPKSWDMALRLQYASRKPGRKS